MENGFRKVGLVVDWEAKFQDVAFALQMVYGSGSNFNAMDLLHREKLVVVYSKSNRFMLEMALKQFSHVFKEVDWDCDDPEPDSFSYESFQD